MGCFHSKDEKVASLRSKQIDLKLKNDQALASRQVKLLLLGKCWNAFAAEESDIAITLM